MATDTGPAPWERQPGEPARAYGAFCIYRDLPPHERSLRAVAERLGGKRSETGRRSTRPLERWSSRWRWVERAERYDDYMDRQYRLEQEEARKEMARRHAHQAMLFQQKVIERLRTLKPEELSPSEVARWFDVAVRVERLSRGESTEITEVEHSGQVSNRYEYDLNVQIEEYADIYEKLARRGSFTGHHEGDDPGEPVHTP